MTLIFSEGKIENKKKERRKEEKKKKEEVETSDEECVDMQGKWHDMKLKYCVMLIGMCITEVAVNVKKFRVFGCWGGFWMLL